MAAERDGGTRDAAGADRGQPSGGSGKGNASGSKSGTQPRDPAGPLGAISGGSGVGPGARAYNGGRTVTSDPSTEQLLGLGSHGAIIADPSDPTISRSVNSEPFGPSGPNERWGTTLGTDPEIQKKQDEYNSAWDALSNRGIGDWLGDHFKNVLPGMYQKEPVWSDPSSYDGGTYHDAWSPAGALAGVLGMASPVPGTSIATGYVGRKVSDALGGSHYTFGDGGGWSAEDGPGAASVNQMAEAPSAPTEGAGGTLGGRAQQGGAKLFSIADTLRQRTPAQVAVNPSPRAYENLTTYYSDGSKPTTALQPVY